MADQSNRLTQSTGFTIKDVVRMSWKYYKSPEGILHRERLSNSYRGFWNSDEGVDLRLRVGKGLSKYYKENLL